MREVTQHADRVATYTGCEKRCIDALKDAVPELKPELDDLTYAGLAVADGMTAILKLAHPMLEELAEEEERVS